MNKEFWIRAHGFLYKVIIACIIIFSQLPLVAQNDKGFFVSDTVTDSVKCLEDSEESYSLYLPETYNGNKYFPLIMIFDPAARGRTAIGNFVPAGRKFGFILACSNNVRNGSMAKMLSDAEFMYNDILKRFKVDERMIFTAGFSGGSRMATAFSIKNKKISAVIACGAGLPNITHFTPAMMSHLIYFGIVGIKDTNYQEMNDLGLLLENSGILSFILYNERGHEWPPSGNIEIAAGWIKLQMMKKGFIEMDRDFLNDYFQVMTDLAKESERNSDPVDAYKYNKYLLRDFPDRSKTADISDKLLITEKSDSFKKQIREREKIRNKEYTMRERFEEAMAVISFGKGINDSLINIWKNDIRTLVSKTRRNGSSDSLMAFRLINFITIASFESGKNYFSAGNYKAASGFFRIWTICDPSGKYSWLYLARAEALDGQTDEAIADLNRSISYGLGRDQIVNDKAFEGIRNDKKFIRLTGIIK